MIGETIGHFKIVSRLGQGGMGSVYAGEHESIQTRVAVKILHSEVSRDTEHVQRFFNEAKIVGKIKHAGIVKIFDVGFYKGNAYLIMELLEGEPLSARIHATEQIGWAQTADLARQMASVLDATHRAGVIHRDLKPDNTFLVPDHELASGERVKILDFGISKLSGTMAGNSPKTVGTMGTPAYMAPEQWGDSSTIDWRADAYSLGCVVFEMLCGRPPFEASTIYEACGKHMNAKPRPPSELAPETPAALDELVLRLLAKEPAERAVSMAQVSRELDAIAKGQPAPPLSDSMKSHAPVAPATTASLRAPTQPTIRMKPGAEELGTAATAAHPAIDDGKLATPVTADKLERPRTLTTLSSSAAQIDASPPKKRTALIGGALAAIVVIGVVIAVMTHGSGGGGEPQPATAPTEPVAAPVTAPAAAPVPAPSPAPSTKPATPTKLATPSAPADPTPTPPTTPPPPATPDTTTTNLPQHVSHRPGGPRLQPIHKGSGAAVPPATPTPPATPPKDDVGGRI